MNQVLFGQYCYEAKKVLERGDGVALYKEYLWKKIKSQDKAICDELRKIKRIEKEKGSVTLGCFCKPNACHGDVIALALSNERVLELLSQ